MENGARFPKLYLKEYGDDIRGCHTREEIRAEEVLIYIPFKCLITVEMGKECPVSLFFISLFSFFYLFYVYVYFFLKLF